METTEQTLVGSRFQRLEAREDHHGLLGPKTDQPAHPDGMPGPPTFNNNNNNIYSLNSNNLDRNFYKQASYYVKCEHI